MPSGQSIDVIATDAFASLLRGITKDSSWGAWLSGATEIAKSYEGLSTIIFYHSVLQKPLSPLLDRFWLKGN